MKLVIDTNVLMTYFWKDSVFETLIKKYEFTCFSPEYALEELNKYEEIIIKKAKITKKYFKEKKMDLALRINFINEYEYQKSLKKAIKITPDLEDIDFIALSLHLKIGLWSNDKILKEQNTIPIYTTEELLENPHLFII